MASLIEYISRVDAAISMLQRLEPTALKYSPDGFIVGFSGGKDSQVIYQLANMAGIKFRAIHSLTTMDAPQTIYFIREHYPDVQIVRPARNFAQVCIHHKMLPTRNVRFCCRELKESYGNGQVVITGVRRAESLRRSARNEVEIQTRRRHPEYVSGSLDEFELYQSVVVDCLQGKDKLIVNPIIDWEDSHVWEFLKREDLPTNPLYDLGCDRVGCILCPMAQINSKRHEIRLFPKYAERYLRIIRRIREARIETSGTDYCFGHTDSQVFSDWLQEKAPDRSLSLPFDD